MFEPVLRLLEPFAKVFADHSKQIYLVGGAVRNLLLGKAAKDFDFTTDALPHEVASYFPKVVPTGLKHGTVTVLFRGRPYEVTTFRVDGAYGDGRRPDSVSFTPSLEEDLKRRDFTINAMALNLVDGALADPHEGRIDLAKGVLRAIGDPGTRFDEDALRLLRLFRFVSQLGFSIEPGTLAAVPSRRHKLATISRERIREELAKTMAGPRPDLAWQPLSLLGFLEDLLAPMTPRPLSRDSLERLCALDPDLRWPWWLTVSCGDPSNWEPVLHGLTFSNSDIAAFTGPAKALGLLKPGMAKAVIAAWGTRERAVPGTQYLAALEADGFWTDSSGLKDEILRVAASEEPVFVNELAVGGKDIMDEGLASGPRVGETLKLLQREVWADPALNSPERLRQRIRELR